RGPAARRPRAGRVRIPAKHDTAAGAADRAPVLQIDDIVLEIAAHAPQPVGGAVVEIALLGRLAGIEAAAQQVGEIQVGRIAGAGAGAVGKANPQVKVGREGGLAVSMRGTSLRYTPV